MNNRRPSSGGQRRTQQGRYKQSSRSTRVQAERGNTAVLLFFLIMFLILALVLFQARVASALSIILGIVLLALMIGIVSVWLVRRNQTAGMPGTLNRSDVAVTRMAAVASPAGQPVTVADLLQLTPGEFEDFVGDLLTATGMCTDVRRIGGAGDRGADLLANDRFNRPFIVQCKRYHPGHKVRAGEMRNFLGAKGIYGADECLFVTTSTFTEAARENMLHLRNTVFLWDGERLAEVAREYWNSLPERWRYTIRDAHVSIDS